MNSQATAFLEALRAPAPHASLGGPRDVYAPLIGAWDARVVDHLPGGTEREQSAEIHFARILEGRAVQDVWIVPARAGQSSAQPGAEGARYGTTLRVYDPALDAWRVNWWNPLTGVECRLVGNRVGPRIIHTGTDAAGRPLRWSFVDIGPDSFHWRGERSEDGGRSWICDTEFFARRRVAAVAAPVELRAAWEWADRPGLEALLLERTPEGMTARGSVLVVLDGAPLWVRYRIEHDSAWRFRSAKIEVGPPGTPRSIAIRRAEAGGWTIDGSSRPDLAACEELDLMVTPYTNTPPLAARALAVGASRRLCVVWLRFPALDIQVVSQEYARLDSSPEDGPLARYRYRNFTSGFEGELTLDADGLVVDYGPWRRR